MSISISYADGDGAFLSRSVAGQRELRLCLRLVGISALVFVICVPFVRLPVQPSPTFVAVYNAVSTLNDLTTSIILFGQFNILRSRALLLLGSGYLFASVMSAIQLMTFPGMFTSAGLLGAGPQTALWLCIFWHGGFPLIVIFYAISDGGHREIASPPRIAIGTAVMATIGAVFACWLAATWCAEGGRLLPSLLGPNGFTPSQRVVNLTDVVLVMTAFILLWKRSQRSLLNVWLMVVMSYWFCDITLSSYLNGGRYDLGFYAGRIYGALAASFVLAVLVLENSRLYRKLAIAASRLRERAADLAVANRTLQNEIVCRRQAEEELHYAQAELARVSRMSAMGELIGSLADEVSQPIGAIMLNADTCLRWLSNEVPNIERAREIGQMIARDGTRASDTVARIRKLFEREDALRETVDVNNTIREMIALLHGEASRQAVAIRADLMEDLAQVAGNPVQLKQVLMNLMMNGIEAMNGAKGTRELTVTSLQSDNRQIKICVSDTGVGLPALPTNQIFKTFFTTKPNGIGIGLSISRSIVEEHGGRLWAANNALCGASFCLTLPIDQESRATDGLH